MISTRRSQQSSPIASGLVALILLSILAAGCNFPPPATVEPSPAVDLPVPTEISEEPTLEPTAIPPAELIPVDATWNRYVNPTLGFEMLVPVNMVHGHAGCYWNVANGDHSYRPQAGMVPVTIFESGDRVYFTSESFSILTDETEEDGRHYYAGCEGIINSLERVQNREFPNIFWEIISRPIASDADLLLLVHDVYGEACGLGELVPVEGEDYLGVRVESDGLPMEDSSCVMNYMYRFFYHPELGRAVTWALGQAATFYADVNYAEEPYDMQMLESFQFIGD
ncbi:MAG: hypothetical protein JXA97_10995 [Anaerolineales bacterium]|nr:hypothetical protein [Anaerolineales bacterium]